MTAAAAQKVYEQSGLGPDDVDVIELHDCFSANELVTYEALGLCGEGKAGTLVDEGATTTAASGSSTRRAASSRRATRSAPPAWPSAPS